MIDIILLVFLFLGILSGIAEAILISIYANNNRTPNFVLLRILLAAHIISMLSAFLFTILKGVKP